jgi:hypothetical protein
MFIKGEPIMKIMYQITIVVHEECKCGYDEYENYVIAEFATVDEAMDFASKTKGCRLEIDACELDKETRQWRSPDNKECLGYTDGEMDYHDK